MDKSSALFDFAPYLAQREEVIGLIREFASHQAFRSAAVEELELDEEFYRRPLRPEDLEFLQFKKAVPALSISRLPSLATQRLLMSLNEVGVARMPRKDVDGEFARFDAFYGDQNQVLGARIRPFLEHYGFTFLGREASRDDTSAALAERLRTLIDDETAFWADMFAMLARNDYLVDGLRFIMIQRWSLAPSRRVAVERAEVSGYFNAVPAADRPQLAAQASDPLLATVAEFAGVTKREHSYWQFYLPTSMAKCNLLYALGSRPDRAFALLGAAFAAEAEAVAFQQALAAACPHLVPQRARAGAAETDAAGDLCGRFARALAAVEAEYGAEGRFRVSQGLGAGVKLAERARWDLGEQLKWLSAIEHYIAFAEKIDRRIAAECPGIDRETFVEPRDMCSTTHVHNDHRLVVIQSSAPQDTVQMHFWGNLGMRLEMKQGDKVLIPDGRLHGSTVICEECTYDQPIIPEEWIAELLDAPRREAAQAA